MDFFIKERSKVMRTARSEKLERTVLAGIFSALIFVFTAFIHIPVGAGYIHAGDGLIYLAASLLPVPYAVVSAVLGGVLADGLSGYPVWIPATAVVKAVTALFFSNKGEKVLTARNIAAIFPAAVVCVVGYSVYEGAFLSGGFNKAALTAAFMQTPAYLVQTAASAVLYIAAAMAFDRSKIAKKRRS